MINFHNLFMNLIWKTYHAKNSINLRYSFEMYLTTKFVILRKSNCFSNHAQMQYVSNANRFFLNHLIKWYYQITKFDISSKEKCLSHKSRIMFTLNSHQAKSVLDIPSKFLIPSLAYKIKSHHALKNFEVSVENEWIFLKNM